MSVSMARCINTLAMKKTVDYGRSTVYTDTVKPIERRDDMYTEAAKTASSKYDAANTVQLKMKLNRKTDADILGKLAAVGNKQGYIKSLIRADMQGE